MAKKKINKTKNVRQNQSVLLLTLGSLLFSIALLEGNSAWLVMHRALFGLLGWSAFLLGPIFVYTSVILASKKSKTSALTRTMQSILLVLFLGAITNIFTLSELPQQTNFLAAIRDCYGQGINYGGGLISGILAWPLLKLCGVWEAGIIIAILILAFIMLVFGITIIDIYETIKKAKNKARNKVTKVKEQQLKRLQLKNGADACHKDACHKKDKSWIKDMAKLDKIEQEKTERPRQIEPVNDVAQVKDETLNTVNILEDFEKSPDEIEKGETKDEFLNLVSENHIEKREQENNPDNYKADKLEKTEMFNVLQADETLSEDSYKAPNMEFLKAPKNVDFGKRNGELHATAAKLTETLKSFGVGATITEVSCGPSVTRYELQPSVGIKISKITNLADDIALNLAAAGVRIEAPIPNKSAVGIEVPNKITSVVNIREIIESEEFQKSKSKLTVALGKDISGNISIADISKMPHLLIAGATGSGKSVCINSLIVSLIYKASPEDVKLLLIDPKVVELGIYNGIPHLLIPVVIDPKKAAGALGWAVCEMLNRYKLLAENSVRDFERYNELAKTDESLKKLPQIVIIIDELADLMMVAPNDVEDSICRLAQMARAAGMHLVIATQRPSVDVITGIIKANIPSRIAFAVSSQVDSRTIIDSSGAEKLVGRGDMLFLSVGQSKPQRIQGCLVSDEEIERVTDFVKQEANIDYDEEVINEIEKHAIKEKSGTKAEVAKKDAEMDELIHKAVRCVVEYGQASTSLLQRKLKIGYSRAARILDEMEEQGIVSESIGSKPRKVLMSKVEWLEWENRREG
ncbi:MAG: DNA translocase FtsK [Oscillospiraceae bacterium]